MAGFGVDRGSGSSSGNPDSTISEALIDAKGDLIVGTADNIAARLAVGANETRLVADSAEATGLKWVADTINYAIAAKGDILAGTAADTAAALTVGANETRLVADSAQASGLKYVADTINYAIAAKGDILAGTAADTVAALSVGTSGYVLVAASGEATGLQWQEKAASDTAAGFLETATQAEQETGTDTTRAVTPGRQHFHPSAVKGWVKANIDGTVDGSYNVTSVTDNGTADITVNWATDFADVNYVAVNAVKVDFGGAATTTFVTSISNTGFAAGTTRGQMVRVSDGTITGGDPNEWMFVAFGDFA